MNPDTQHPESQSTPSFEQPQPMPEQVFIQPQPVQSEQAYVQQPAPVAPQQPEEQSAGQHKVNPLSSVQPGEQTIFAVHRHIIGILGVYIGALLLIGLFGFMAIIMPSILTWHSVGTVRMISVVFFLVAVLAVSLFAWVAHVVYYGNSWILTSDSLTQIRQTGLFDKQNSQLSLGNLEDISAVQNGIFPHMFNYGSLRVETASERGRFVLSYCPNPNEYARQILDAREKFEQQGRR